MVSQIRPAIMVLVSLTIMTGFVYPLAMTGIAGAILPWQSQGSLVTVNGKVVGSTLIGQHFAADKYFNGRPSSTTGTDTKGNSVPQPYNAANSMGSNLGPTSKALSDRVKASYDALHAENPNMPVPVDLVTTSASGLDPDISPEAALFQVPRVAKARGITPSQAQQLVAQQTQGRLFGLIGEPHVNVLALNLALDQLAPAK
jgi:K+-transporting ATPase ATPase C chain